MVLDVELILLILPAFVAGALISIVHVPLGQEVLRRNIIFLDLAIAQFAGLGMIIFHAFAHVYIEGSLLLETYGGLACALLLALLCAIGFQYIESRAGKYQEALIGSAFIVAASLTLLIMSDDPHGNQEIKDILAGQILWVGWQEIIKFAPVFLGVLAAWHFFKPLRPKMFYFLFALAIPFSVQLIGIYLVFASLILPALAVIYVERAPKLKGYVLSLLGYFFGLVLSYFCDWPSGPAIVLSFSIVCGIGFVFYKRVHKRA